MSEVLKYILIHLNIDCGKDGERKYESLPIFEKFYYVKPFICAYLNLNKEWWSELRHGRYRRSEDYLKQLEDLTYSVRREVDSIENLLPSLCDDEVRQFIAFQLVLIKWMIKDAADLVKKCEEGHGGVGCIESTIRNRLRRGIEYMRRPEKCDEPWNLYIGLHLLRYLQMLSYYLQDGRESAVLRSLNTLLTKGLDRSSIAIIINDIKGRFGNKWRDVLREWHSLFSTLLGGASLTVSWDFEHVNNQLVNWLLELIRDDELEKTLNIMRSGSATRTYPGRELLVRPTFLGNIIAYYTLRVKYIDLNEEKLRSDLSKIGKIFCTYASKLVEIKKNEDIAINNKAKELYLNIINNIKEYGPNEIRDDIELWTSAKDIAWDIIFFLIRRASRDSFIKFWLQYPFD